MPPYLTKLRAIPGLEHCNRTDLEAIARVGEQIAVPAGGALIEPMDRWTGMCIIEHGQAVVHTPAWTVVLPSGSRIVRHSRDADTLRALARTDLTVLALSRRQPQAINLALDLSSAADH